MSAVAIYFRLGEVVVIPQGGGGGHFVDIEPILVVPPEADAVQSAVMDSIQVSAVSPYADETPKGWKSPVLKRFGLRSYKTFTEGATLCFVFEDNGAFEVERWQHARDGRGLEQAPEGARLLNDINEMGEAVLQALGVK